MSEAVKCRVCDGWTVAIKVGESFCICEFTRLREEIAADKKMFEDQVKVREALREERDRLLKENEVLIWNLGGCSTYALGYGIHEPHSKEMARPALEDVKRLAVKCDRYRKALEILYNELDDQSCEEQPIACSLRDIAKQALSGSEGER